VPVPQPHRNAARANILTGIPGFGVSYDKTQPHTLLHGNRCGKYNSGYLNVKVLEMIGASWPIWEKRQNFRQAFHRRQLYSKPRNIDVS
jgi:hypothetical protein